ncbi:hypothetical protein AMJ80_09540 [bacterium SM23_31]|nr:MAG: hypothetical protein AMJ80_09540 [bacterium SM23_31]
MVNFVNSHLSFLPHTAGGIQAFILLGGIFQWIPAFAGMTPTYLIANFEFIIFIYKKTEFGIRFCILL